MGERKYASRLSTRLAITCTVVVGVFMLIPVSAMAFRTEVGDVGVKADITLGYGSSFRVEDDTTSASSPNFKTEATFDHRGLVSNVFKATAELEADWRNFGAVANMNYTHDTMIANKNTGRGGQTDPDFLFGLTSIDTGMGNEWSEETKDESGHSFDLLDAYLYGMFLDDALDVRVGRQVINWGEGLFFVDGVAEQTPLNVNKLVLPGSELKEAYLGLGAVQTQWSVTDTLSIDAYWQWEWQKNKLPGIGTYYGDDIVGPGGQEEWSNDALLPGLRGDDLDADDHGQWGISTRALLGDVELGFYYSRYHEKMPVFTFESNPASPLLAAALLGDPAFAGAPIPGTKVRQTYLEDSDMFGTSIAFTLGSFSVNGEVAYRPDRALVTPLSNFLLAQDGQAWDERDTWNASVHTLWLGGEFIGGIDSQFAAVQVGMDYIDGDTSTLAPNNVIHDNPAAKVDSASFGVAASWDGTWQAVASRNIDLTLNLFAQYDFAGNSHFWGNFAEDRLLSSVGLTGAFGSDWEANVNYARQDFDDSHYENQDTINLSVNYKF